MNRPRLLIALTPLCLLAASAAPVVDHWSLKPVERPAVPENATPTGAIDAFVRATLQEKGITPSTEADRRTLCRRVYFDVIGLPPTPEEMDAFVNDAAPDAYEKLVDKLLASPHFGERWAAPWLDTVRFAESDGYETNIPRANAWPYRDYVIRSINEDRPYDRFVVDQLAGDVTGADEATGFLVAGPVDRVLSPDPGLTAQQRADSLNDIIGTTGSTFLGLTVACARCHDHKFDPIPQTDYYALKAVFDGVQHGERPMRRPAAENTEQQIAQVRKDLEAAWQDSDDDVPLATTPEPAPPVNARRNVERFLPVTAKWVRFSISATNAVEPCIDELEVFSTDTKTNVATKATATSSGNYGNDTKHQLIHINDGRYGNSFSWISSTPGRGWVTLEFPEAQKIDRIVWGRDRLGEYNDRLATAYQIEVATEPDQWRIVASSGHRRPFSAETPSTAPNPKIAALQARLAELTGGGPKVYAGTFPGDVPPTKLFNRGDPLQPRQDVKPGALEVLPVLFLKDEKPLLSEMGRYCDGSSPPSLTDNQRRRLALAEWIANPKNPLTARVAVNRVWLGHFGEGLVTTPGDLGTKGAAPSHPQLLDWLAAELVSHGWSLKHIHRLILTSATYRQSSEARADAMAVDAASRWLWRFPPRRLDAEMIRDGMLTTSGVLDLRAGGPGFSAFEANDNYVRVYKPKAQFAADDWRRMIYQTRIRMRQDGTFGVFDCPDGGQVAPRRIRSTTPLQALNMLNSPFIEQQATLFAERLKKCAGDDPATQVRLAFRFAFQRNASADEEKGAVALAGEHGMSAVCRALLNTNEFLFLF